MTDDRHARVCRGRDAIAEVLRSHGWAHDFAQERANNVATGLGGCVPGDDIVDAVDVMLGDGPWSLTARVLGAWVETERGDDHG